MRERERGAESRKDIKEIDEEIETRQTNTQTTSNLLSDANTTTTIRHYRAIIKSSKIVKAELLK